VSLDEVLEIMHLARGRYRRIEARLQRRVDAQVCSRAARWQGADFRASFGLLEALDHIWFESGSRYRVQTETGTRTGFVHVQNGVRSHRHDPNNDSASGTYENVGYGDAPPTYRQVWWEPNLLIPEMWLQPNGKRRVAGRERSSSAACPAGRVTISSSSRRRTHTSSSSTGARRPPRHDAALRW
jgi:hypothetical protein